MYVDTKNYGIFATIELQREIISFIQNDETTFEMIKKLFLLKKINLDEIHNVATIIESVVLHEQALENNVKLAIHNIKFTTEQNNYEFYNIYQKHEIWDNDRVFSFVIENNNTDFINHFLQEKENEKNEDEKKDAEYDKGEDIKDETECNTEDKYPIYLSHLIDAVKHINNYDIICRMVDIYIKKYGCSNNLSSFVSAVIKNKSIKLIKKITKCGLKFSHMHLLDALKTKDLIILEYILSNTKPTKHIFSSVETTYLRYILGKDDDKSYFDIMSPERCSNEYRASATDLFNIHKISIT
jgi:hypothetical protein